MPIQRTSRLTDLSSESLTEVLEAFETRYPQAIVSDPNELSTQEGRDRFLFRSAQHQVVVDMRVALAEAKRREVSPNRRPSGVLSNGL